MGRSWGRVAGGAALMLVLALSAGCSRSVVSVDREDLIGSWTWIRSTGGIAAMTRTPETEGYAGELRFRPDRTVEWRVDGELLWSTTYSLGLGRPGTSTAGREVVRYGEAVFGWEEQLVSLDVEGRLTLTDPCCDGYVHEYVREES